MTKFKGIVQKIEQGLSPSPPVFWLQNLPQVAGGKIVTPTRLFAVTVTYDVRRTTSLVTPIIGEVRLNALRQTTDSCGTTNVQYLGRVVVTLDEAKETVSRAECWRPDKNFPTCALRFTYGYRDGNWEFVSMVDEQPIACTTVINVALGKGLPPGYYMELNAPWKGLIPGL